MQLPKQLEPYRDKKIWVCYVREELPDGRKTKPPIDAHTLKSASSTNTATWATFDEAEAQIGKKATFYSHNAKSYLTLTIEGVGVMFENNDLLGLDFDHVIDEKTGKVQDERVKAIWKRVASYTEISPSGTGVHILVRAKNTNPELNTNGLPKGLKNIIPGYELYDNGRYFTVTGRALSGSPGVEERQEVIDEIIKEWLEIRDRQAKKQLKKFSSSSGGSGERKAISESNRDLWEKMFNSRRGKEIRALYDGDFSACTSILSNGEAHADHSKADLILCKDLAYWTNGDASRIDEMFRESGLYRPKWDKEDYRSRTISQALQGFTAYREHTAEEKKAYAQAKEAEELAEFDRLHPHFNENMKQWAERKRQTGTIRKFKR